MRKRQSPRNGHAHVFPKTTPVHQVWVLGDEGEADGTTPVLHNEDHVLKSEPLNEPGNHLVVTRRLEVEARGCCRQTEAWIVEGHAPMVGRQAVDQLAIEERPGRVAVEHEERDVAFALVDVMDCRAVHLHEFALEWKQRLIEPTWALHKSSSRMTFVRAQPYPMV